MDNSIIGTQITKFRKAAGITQEELGKAVGVSTQAVSRWENGGAPDVTLLPAIADKLAVSIDALFGREDIEKTDMCELAGKWFLSLPKEERYAQLNRLIWAAIRSPYDLLTQDYVSQCIEPTTGSLITSNIRTENGIYCGVNAEDMTFSIVCPEPESGYKAYFGDNEQYRKLFSALAVPGCLEVLIYMLGQNKQFASAELLSKETGIEVNQVEHILETMSCFVVESLGVETLNGTLKGYGICDTAAYVPFLYLARYLMEEKTHFYNIGDREKPML